MPCDYIVFQLVGKEKNHNSDFLKSYSKKYYFKTMDGLFYLAVYTMCNEPIAIHAVRPSSNAFLENCIRICHRDTNASITGYGRVLEGVEIINANLGNR